MKNRTTNFAILWLILCITHGCTKVSIIERDSSAGLNGGFEIIRKGLPANWHIYAPDAYKKSYNLVYDTLNVKEGNQSLKFIIQKVDTSFQEWKKPGFFGSIDATIGDKYKVSFWVKNTGCDFKVKVASEGDGMYEKDIVWTNESFEDWKYYQDDYTVPEPFPNVRFEVNIFSPGEFWIDDVKIEKIDNQNKTDH
jgi:hypothetical protein